MQAALRGGVVKLSLCDTVCTGRTQRRTGLQDLGQRAAVTPESVVRHVWGSSIAQSTVLREGLPDGCAMPSTSSCGQRRRHAGISMATAAAPAPAPSPTEPEVEPNEQVRPPVA